MSISRNRWELAQNYKDDICRFQYLLSNGIIVNVILFDLDLLFKVKLQLSISQNGESLRKTARGYIYRFQHLPSNCIIANVVLFDIDLLFQGQLYSNGGSLPVIVILLTYSAHRKYRVISPSGVGKAAFCRKWKFFTVSICRFSMLSSC